MKGYSYLSRRKFFNLFKFLFIFLLTSCTNKSRSIVIGFQKSFFPKSFKNLLPNIWKKENIDFNDLYNPQNITKYKKLDYLLINDGWINKLEVDDFKDLDEELFSQLNNKSNNFLRSFENKLRNKLFPVGVIPYAVVIKNNFAIEKLAKQSWNFLLSKDLKGKIILPKSPRVILSIAERIDEKKSLNRLINQQNIYDDKNSLDWLLNTKAVVAVMPYTLCQEIIKIDSRLSLVFPRKGVPLIWQFVLCKTNSNQRPLIDWIKSLENDITQKKLLKEGWFVPFENLKVANSSNKMNKSSLPSNECWKNSWSLSPLNKSDKTKLELLWGTLLTP
tara:strand:+ start:238 stop:1233 length:996 start_codon:yes stop_codon:yes gene_type:complete